MMGNFIKKAWDALGDGPEVKAEKEAKAQRKGRVPNNPRPPLPPMSPKVPKDASSFESMMISLIETVADQGLKNLKYIAELKEDLNETNNLTNKLAQIILDNGLTIENLKPVSQHRQKTVSQQKTVNPIKESKADKELRELLEGLSL